MGKGLVGRLCWLVLILLFSAGSAWCQFQNPIVWGWPSQSNTGNAEPRPQTAAPSNSPVDNSAPMGRQSSQATSEQSSSDAQSQTAQGASDQSSSSAQSQTSQDTSDQGSSNSQSQTPVNLSGQGSADSAGINPATGDTIINGPANPNATVRFPFPLQVQPQGVKVGPFYVTNVSDSFFYVANSSPGEPSSSFAGNSISANIVCIKQIGGGTLAIQGQEQFSVSQLTPYFNQSVSASYTDQLTERWAMTGSAEFTYFQNSILANPQYLLTSQPTGIVVQTLFALQRGYTLYESNALDFTYQLSGRTHLTLSPILGATFTDQNGSWISSQQLGGAVGVTRDLSDNLTVGGYYFLSHSLTLGTANYPSWNSQSLGVSFQYRRDSWSFAGSVAASGQLVAQVWDLTPGGSFAIRKSFSKSSISGAYSRAEASNVFVSSGYFDQADVSFQQVINQKLQFNAFAGAFRTVETGVTQKGKRIGASVSYRWTPRLNLNAGYNFAHQVGAQTQTFSPLLGNTRAFSVGLSWALGANPGS